MPVAGLDHVNIQTPDVEATARFYADLLGLRPTPTPGGRAPDKGRWLVDDAGDAVIHLIKGEGEGGTGPIHHVAFRCTDLTGTRARLEAMGRPFDQSVGTAGRIQIFTQDCHGIRLELNFPAD